MSRTVVEMESKNNQESESAIRNTLELAGFEEVTEKDETFWTNTEFPAHMCIKYTFEGNKLILEGWVKIFRIASFVKSAYSEKELKGWDAKLPKKTCKKAMDTLVEMVEDINSRS